MRGSSVRPRRRSGPPIRGRVIRRGAAGFRAAAHVYNERFDDVLPSVVARPVDAADVRDAVRWAVTNGVPLRARSGGHSYAGYSTLSGGMVLDLRNMRRITRRPAPSHGHDRRRITADRRVLRPGRPWGDDPGRLLSVGGDRRPRARRRDGAGRPPVRTDRRQSPERPDRDRGRAPADRQQASSTRISTGLCGAAEAGTSASSRVSPFGPTPSPEPSRCSSCRGRGRRPPTCSPPGRPGLPMRAPS